MRTRRLRGIWVGVGLVVLLAWLALTGWGVLGRAGRPTEPMETNDSRLESAGEAPVPAILGERKAESARSLATVPEQEPAASSNSTEERGVITLQVKAPAAVKRISACLIASGQSRVSNSSADEPIVFKECRSVAHVVVVCAGEGAREFLERVQGTGGAALAAYPWVAGVRCVTIVDVFPSERPLLVTLPGSEGPADNTVRITVVTHADRVVAGATVRIAEPSNQRLDTVYVADEKGVVLARRPRGSYFVAATDEVSQVSVWVTDESRTEVALRLPPVVAANGRVVDDLGTPVPHAVLITETGLPERYACSATGEFALPVFPGDSSKAALTVLVTAPGICSEWFGINTRLAAELGDDRVDLGDLQVVRSHEIGFEFVDEAGVPLPGVLVEASGNDVRPPIAPEQLVTSFGQEGLWRLPIRGISNEHGTVQLRVPSDDALSVGASKAGFETWMEEIQTRDKLGTTTRVTLPPGGDLVVLLAGGEEPDDPNAVILTPARSRVPDRTLGRELWFAGMAVGEHQLELYCKNQPRIVTNVTVAQGVTTVETIDLNAHPALVIEGRVVWDDTGEPCPTATACVGHTVDHRLWFSRVSEDGSFCIRTVPADVVGNLRAWASVSVRPRVESPRRNYTHVPGSELVLRVPRPEHPQQ